MTPASTTNTETAANPIRGPGYTSTASAAPATLSRGNRSSLREMTRPRIRCGTSPYRPSIALAATLPPKPIANAIATMLTPPIVDRPKADITPGTSNVSTRIPSVEKVRLNLDETIVPTKVPTPAARSAAMKIHWSPPPRLIDSANKKVSAPSAARMVATAGAARRTSSGVWTRMTTLSGRVSIVVTGMRLASTASTTNSAAATTGSHSTPTVAISTPPTVAPIPPAIVPVLAKCPLAETSSARSGASWATIAVLANAYALRDNRMPNTNG